MELRVADVPMGEYNSSVLPLYWFARHFDSESVRSLYDYCILYIRCHGLCPLQVIEEFCQYPDYIASNDRMVHEMQSSCMQEVAVLTK
jgi:hypothetical protein